MDPAFYSLPIEAFSGFASSNVLSVSRDFSLQFFFNRFASTESSARASTAVPDGKRGKSSIGEGQSFIADAGRIAVLGGSTPGKLIACGGCCCFGALW